MKKITLLLAILFSISLSSQELYWYDVILEVEGEDTVEFEKTVDKFYSSVDFPDDVTMTFSAIPLKGKGYEETQCIKKTFFKSIFRFRISLNSSHLQAPTEMNTFLNFSQDLLIKSKLYTS